jgi:DNA-binding NtrC family response regulator
VVVLAIPPLRTRGQDILVLAEHFLRRYATVHGVDSKRLSGAAKAWLRGYNWPGNVRELSHLMERITLLSPETLVDAETLAPLRLAPLVAVTPGAATPASGASVLRDEAAQIRQALEQTHGNVVRAARLLGLRRSTLRYRMVRSRLGTPRDGAAPALRADRRGAAMPPHGWSCGRQSA